MNTIHDLKLWYDASARHCASEALPLGNGRIGAMIFGDADEERIVLNESSVWSGSRQEADRPDAHKTLPEIRRLLRQGNNVQAEALVDKHFTCQGPGSGDANGAHVAFGCYQVLGNLRLKFAAANGAVEDYRRELDLSTATARVNYRRRGVAFQREHFVSAPDEVFVSRLTADRPGALSFTVVLDRPERFETRAVTDHELLMTGTLDDGHGGKGVAFASRLRLLAKGGTVSADGNHLRIDGADEVMMLVAAATDFRGFAGRQLTDPLGVTTADLDKAAAKSFVDLQAAQQRDHQQWFHRVSLRLADGADEATAALPTDQRLIAFAEGAPDPSLAALYFNYGRYLLIGSSRPSGLPANLQGIWAEEIQTPWNGDWHLDINVQMNYWPAEVCNLSELHEPLHRLIASLVEPGKKTARAYYGARGWVAHVITNAWGFTSPGERAAWGATTGGSAWLCEHLWEHYAYTLDQDFLAWAYPILKGAAQFYLDNLIEEPRHQWLVTGPSNSPENSFELPDGARAHVCLGPSIDMQQLRELFGNTARATAILGCDAGFRQELIEKRGRLAPNQIGPDGRLQEWLEPYAEPEPQHRHLSPMYGLHPYHEITSKGTPALAEACRKFLDARGDASVGWSLAWRINLWARLGDGNRAYALLKRLLKPFREREGINDSGGTHPNLFDVHPPFMIDGNFGACAGIAEMLLQSRACGQEAEISNLKFEIELLPALPAAWPTGSVNGLRARGGFEVDLTWQDGRLIEATIRSLTEAPCRVHYGTKTVNLTLQRNEPIVWKP